MPGATKTEMAITRGLRTGFDATSWLAFRKDLLTVLRNRKIPLGAMQRLKIRDPWMMPAGGSGQANRSLPASDRIPLEQVTSGPATSAKVVKSCQPHGNAGSESVPI